MMQLSWNAVDGIMQRAVARGLARREPQEIRRVGVDETSFQKRHEYVTIVSNHDGGKVLYVADDRKQESLDGYFETLSPDQKEQIEVVSMDMWPAYIGSTRKHIEDADSKICFDKFHVAKAFGHAVDQVRRNEHKQLIQEGYTDLTRTRYLWLRNPHNMSRTQWRSFHALRTSSLKTARAWAIKEAAMSLWDYTRRGWAKRGWKQLLGWASRSRLEPVKRVARMVRTHLWGIINAIILRADNGQSESVNAKIQKIKARACGFRNRERFRNAIYFHCGGLDLYPAGVGSSSS
jgi:transposase